MSFAIYEKVTNQIIAQLEVGTIPWTQPWKNQKTGGVMPQNAATGRPYSGINIPILWGAASAYGYPTHSWMTFNQAIEQKACVRKGEKGNAGGVHEAHPTRGRRRTPPDLDAEDFLRLQCSANRRTCRSDS
jgi:antirestriction protein ArdC